jgi:large subunit ribosomal protein L25
MHETHTLEVERRERLGSRYAARERARGKLPCVLYGQNREPAHLLLDAKAALRFFHSGERLFMIALGDKTQHVLLKDLQFDYLGTNVIHCDLVRVELEQEVEVNIPLKLIGEAKGQNTAGAVLVQKLTEVPVKCTVASMPEELRLNISDLGAGENMPASEIELPQGVELTIDPETIAVVISVQSEEAEPTAEAAAVEGAAAPERIDEKPKSEDDEKDEG